MKFISCWVSGAILKIGVVCEEFLEVIDYWWRWGILDLMLPKNVIERPVE